MELTPFLDGLRRDLTAAAAPGGPEVTRAAELLGNSLAASARLCLLEALSQAAAEITTKLPDDSVDVRLHGRDAQFVVTRSDHVVTAPPTAAPPTAPGEGTASSPVGADGDLARITLRLPEGLKEAVERAAAAEGISANAWLVRAISRTLSGAPPANPPARGRGGRRVTGFAQA